MDCKTDSPDWRGRKACIIGMKRDMYFDKIVCEQVLSIVALSIVALVTFVIKCISFLFFLAPIRQDSEGMC